jgi:hypothetical protein
MSETRPDLRALNTSELLSIIRRTNGMIIRRSVPKERLIQIIEYGIQPEANELSDTMSTRKTLEVFVEKHWTWVNSQLPCKGEYKGKCTVYPCPEGRHIDCFMAARKQDI